MKQSRLARALRLPLATLACAASLMSAPSAMAQSSDPAATAKMAPDLAALLTPAAVSSAARKTARRWSKCS